MAKYTIRVAGKDIVFDAADITAAKQYAESKGWVAGNVTAGDWVTYPTTGYPATRTPQTPPKTAEELKQEGLAAGRVWAAAAPSYTPSMIPFTSYAPMTPYIPSTTTPAGTAEQQEEYEAYVADSNSKLYPNMPLVKSLDDYLKIRNQLMANSEYYLSTVRASLDQWNEYVRFKAFGGQYGDLNDYQANNFIDFINNYDKGISQLRLWEKEAGPEATGFTDDQIRALEEYKQYYYDYGKPDEWMPIDVGDFIANSDKAQKQLSIWKNQAAAVEKYELTPEEAARRREEGYAEERYAAKERYGETPMLRETFAKWIDTQGDFSGALQQYIKSQYPSLQAEYEAQAGRLTGFPTREEARAEASRRESGFAGWLSEEMPEVREEYYGQRPAERGERYYVQAPTTRTVNW